MKKILVVFIGVLNFTFCKGQRVTYNDLSYVLTHNLGEIEDYLSHKGFNYSGADTSGENKDIYAATFMMTARNYYNNILLSKHSLFDGSTLNVSFATHLKSDYVLFKAYIKRIGYVMRNSEITKMEIYPWNSPEEK